MDIQEKLETHRSQIQELSRDIQDLRNSLSELEAKREQLCREQESLLMAMLEDDDYHCPMCDDNTGLVMELKTHRDHFNAITYTLECPKCGLTTPVDCNRLSLLLRWYKFINKIKGKNNE